MDTPFKTGPVIKMPRPKEQKPKRKAPKSKPGGRHNRAVEAFRQLQQIDRQILQLKRRRLTYVRRAQAAIR